MKKSQWTQENIDFIINNYKTMEYKKLSEVTGINYNSIRSKLQKLNLRKGSGFRRNKNDKHHANQDYFKSINSSSAYILGFITADGHICTNGRYRLMIGLNKKDIDTLLFIKKELCPTASIKNYDPNNSISINISGKDLINNLIELGLDTKKSGAYNIVNLLPDTHKYDFIRGFFDGDGCISYTKRVRGKYTSIEGSLSFTNGDIKLLESIQKILGYGSIRKDKRNNCYMLCINSFDKIKKIYNDLYGTDCYYMERKKNKFEQFFKDKESL